MKRQELLDKVGCKCQRCGSTQNIEVHHKNYKNFGCEMIDEDLEVLCRTCHRALHKMQNKFKLLETKKGRKKLRKRGYKIT